MNSKSRRGSQGKSDQQAKEANQERLAFNFADDGLTHFDISAAMGFSAGPLSITPSVHLIIGHDDFTKFTKQNKEHDAKIRREALEQVCLLLDHRPTITEAQKIVRKWANEADGGDK